MSTAVNVKWLYFIRQYGPGSRTDNMYDETIQQAALRAKVTPVQFEHPAEKAVISCFDPHIGDPISVILTGTAGDGKTHLCRQVWEKLNGDNDLWASDNPYLSLIYPYPNKKGQHPNANTTSSNRNVKIHFIKDLSSWAPQQGLPWEPEKQELLQKLCKSLFDPDPDEVFLIAANDGQLIESWRRLADTQYVIQARKAIEDLLVEDRQQIEGCRLRMFNLSRWNSSQIFDRIYDAFINHIGWQNCYQANQSKDQVFGSLCPIRHNYELLRTPLVRSRLRALIELCDNNGLHLSIRQILILLSNAVLGHPDCNDHLMKPSDVPNLINNGTVCKASIYNNLFGGNLDETRRRSITVFDYFDRFQLGYETCNRIDNILIFGEGDPELGKHFETLMRNDPFYGADDRYFAARDRYIEGADGELDDTKEFLNMLVAQRRGLFFKIPEELVKELKLWELTVFRFGGEYLSEVLGTLRAERPVKRPISSRLIKGLNRIFIGMLVNSDRELFLATGGSNSQSKVSRVLVDRVSVEPRHGEHIILDLSPNGHVQLSVYLSNTIHESLDLNLVRYEFISRVATEGALPASFSKECYEDLLAFKSRLLAAYEKRAQEEGINLDTGLNIRILRVSEQGLPEDQFVEVVDDLSK